MRNYASCSAVVGLALLAIHAPAHADGLAGSYEVKFEQTMNSCEHPIAYPQHGSIKIEVKGGDLQVDIDRTPLMVGKPTKNGKINAKSPRPGHTPIQGMDGVFTVTGRVTSEGMLSLTLLGEFQASGKPLCTQSWNLAGLRAAPEKPDKPEKPEKPEKSEKPKH